MPNSTINEEEVLEDEALSEDTLKESNEESLDEYQEELKELEEKKNGKLTGAARRLAEKEAKESKEVDIEKLVEEKTQALRQEMQESRTDELINRYARNDNEAQLIRYHLENTIKPSGKIADDVRNAVALANRRRLESEMEEVGRAANARGSVSNYSAGGRKTTKKADPKQALSEADKRFIKATGMSDELVKKALSRKNN